MVGICRSSNDNILIKLSNNKSGEGGERRIMRTITFAFFFRLLYPFYLNKLFLPRQWFFRRAFILSLICSTDMASDIMKKCLKIIPISLKCISRSWDNLGHHPTPEIIYKLIGFDKGRARRKLRELFRNWELLSSTKWNFMEGMHLYRKLMLLHFTRRCFVLWKEVSLRNNKRSGVSGILNTCICAFVQNIRTNFQKNNYWDIVFNFGLFLIGNNLVLIEIFNFEQQAVCSYDKYVSFYIKLLPSVLLNEFLHNKKK